MKRIFQSLFAAVLAVAMSGCGSIQQLGADAALGVVQEVTDVLTGPDSDYKNYLSTCLKEHTAWLKSQEERSTTTRTALASPHKEIAFSAFVQFAVEGARGSAVPKCSVERKPGWLENTNVFDIAFRVYQENRAGSRFNRQLDADKELAKARMDHERRMTRENNDLLTTLTGDKLEQFKAQAEADSQARKDAAAAK